MGHGTHTLRTVVTIIFRTAIELVTVSESIYLYAIEHHIVCRIAHRAIIVVIVVEVGLSRPQSRIASTCCLTVTGIDNVQVLDLTVAVPVIFSPVDIVQAVNLRNSLMCKLPRILVVSIPGTAAIMAVVVVHLDRADDIECQVEQSVALVLEVVVDRTDGAFLIGVAFLVDHVPVVCRVMTGSELLVREFRKDNYTLVLTGDVTMVRRIERSDRVGASLSTAHLQRACRAEQILVDVRAQALNTLYRSSACQLNLTGCAVGGVVGQDIRAAHTESDSVGIVISVVGLQDRHAVLSNEIMQAFVADEHQPELGSVRLADSPPNTFSRNSECRCCRCYHKNGDKK